jgi:hypothetical protein
MFLRFQIIKLLCQLTQFDAKNPPQIVDFIPRLGPLRQDLALKKIGTAFGYDFMSPVGD